MKDSLMQHCTSEFLANLGGLIFKTFCHVALNHGGASFVPNHQRPPFQNSCIRPWELFQESTISVSLWAPTTMELYKASRKYNFKGEYMFSCPKLQNCLKCFIYTVVLPSFYFWLHCLISSSNSNRFKW